ncbi:uncharacterized protein V1516DRAFT_676631 [Lipomyces oligophaga]|uniref:uncharacterized protein n=1 Tax=Lipomyces oligophaga TaxID=45792 RepID=UPI0034CE49F7
MYPLTPRSSLLSPPVSQQQALFATRISPSRLSSDTLLNPEPEIKMKNRLRVIEQGQKFVREISSDTKSAPVIRLMGNTMEESPVQLLMPSKRRSSNAPDSINSMESTRPSLTPKTLAKLPTWQYRERLNFYFLSTVKGSHSLPASLRIMTESDTIPVVFQRLIEVQGSPGHELIIDILHDAYMSALIFDAVLRDNPLADHALASDSLEHLFKLIRIFQRDQLCHSWTAKYMVSVAVFILTKYNRTARLLIHCLERDRTSLYDPQYLYAIQQLSSIKSSINISVFVIDPRALVYTTCIVSSMGGLVIKETDPMAMQIRAMTASMLQIVLYLKGLCLQIYRFHLRSVKYSKRNKKGNHLGSSFWIQDTITVDSAYPSNLPAVQLVNQEYGNWIPPIREMPSLKISDPIPKPHLNSQAVQPSSMAVSFNSYPVSLPSMRTNIAKSEG